MQPAAGEEEAAGHELMFEEQSLSGSSDDSDLQMGDELMEEANFVE